MTALPQIQAVGPPPERHADRVVGLMMRCLAQQSAHLESMLKSVIGASADGSPAAQKRMEARIRNTGKLLGRQVVATSLKPGKRGRYRMSLSFPSGWDSWRDEEITVGDDIPFRPWIAIWHTVIKSTGNGRREVRWRRNPVCFVSHHVLSRAAQRSGARTVEDMLGVILAITDNALGLLVEKGHPEWLETPPPGWHVPFTNGSTLVLQRHETHKALVAVTLL
jgi:hypothetical protein